jgi:hypothetical protein
VAHRVPSDAPQASLYPRPALREVPQVAAAPAVETPFRFRWAGPGVGPAGQWVPAELQRVAAPQAQHSAPLGPRAVAASLPGYCSTASVAPEPSAALAAVVAASAAAPRVGRQEAQGSAEDSGASSAVALACVRPRRDFRCRLER